MLMLSLLLNSGSSDHSCFAVTPTTAPLSASVLVLSLWTRCSEVHICSLLSDVSRITHTSCITIQAALPGESLELSLPSTGCGSDIIVKRLLDREKKNVQVAHGHSTVSGTVYMQGKQTDLIFLYSKEGSYSSDYLVARCKLSVIIIPVHCLGYDNCKYMPSQLLDLSCYWTQV